MALPTVVRNWQFRVNQAIAPQGSALNTNRKIMFELKQSLIGQGSGWTNRAGGSITPAGNWTVVGSSNGSVAAMDGVDRWTAETDLTWASTGARRWIVLQQTGILAKFQLLLSLISTGGSVQYMDVSVSHLGFGAANGGTDGSTTVNPTALSQINLLSGGSAQWGGAQGDYGTVLNVLRTASGEATRIYMVRNSRVVGEWYLERLDSFQPGWTTPYYALATGIGTNAPVSEYVSLGDFLGSSALGRSWGTAQLTLRATCEGSDGGPLFNILTGANHYSGRYPLFGVGIYASSVNIGRHALWPDFWFGLNSLATGHCYPLTPSETREFCQFGYRVVPWNGSIPVLTA